MKMLRGERHGFPFEISALGFRAYFCTFWGKWNQLISIVMTVMANVTLCPRTWKTAEKLHKFSKVKAG